MPGSEANHNSGNANAKWAAELPVHPIFKAPGTEASVLSLSTVKNFRQDGASASGSAAGTSAKVCFRGPDVILAVGQELRIATLAADSKTSGATGQYKTIHTPNVQFEIHQISLAPGGKLLAVAGAHQVAVIVLPRPSYHKLVSTRVDCKAIQVGQYYHAVSGSSRVTKIGWHPWNDGGTSLLVLTADSIFREYDISQDTEEPQQTLSFAAPTVSGQYTNEDPSAREAISFCIGRGTADWSPLTVYGLMRNGDVYAICPFLPTNASVPKNYVPALEFFVAAKRELIERGFPASAPIPSHHPRPSASTSDPASAYTFEGQEADELAIMNDQQLKFVNALTKQIAKLAAAASPESNAHGKEKNGKTKTHITLQPPRSASRFPLARQGPFLLQPAPPEIEGGLEEEPEATDIVYVEVGVESENKDAAENENERLGVVAIVYRDGRVDLCLDTEKVEGRWDVHAGQPSSSRSKEDPLDLPSFTVYESIDLGLVSRLRSAFSSANTPSSSSAASLFPLLEANHPTIHIDPLYAGRLFISHAFGAHLIDMGAWMRTLFTAMQDEITANVAQCAKEAKGSDVTHLLDTFSAESSSAAPLIGMSIVDDAFIGYSLVAVTSQYQAVPIELSMRPEHVEHPAGTSSQPQSQHAPSRSPAPSSLPQKPSPVPSSSGTQQKDKEKAYISLLAQEPFSPPTFRTRQPSAISVPPSSSNSPSTSMASARGTPQAPITPAVLRAFGARVESLRADMRDASSAVNTVQKRIELQHREMQRQLLKLGELEELISALNSTPSSSLPSSPIASTSPGSKVLHRVHGIVDAQKALGARLDSVLQRLMDAHASAYDSGLSEFESAWFAELGRMKREVGVGGDDGEANGRSLKARTELLKHQLTLLQPQLEALNKKEAERKRPARRTSSHAQAISGLGSAQLRSVQRRLAQETKILEGAKEQAEQLTQWLEHHRTARLDDD